MYYSLINSMNRVVAPSYTARTTAFATATGITDSTILVALNTFDLGLISNGLDTKMKALYPFVGGTASTHKYNFMDARDLDVAFRLQFNGGWTHSSTGALPNGTNAFADTCLSPPTALINNNYHLGHYSRTQKNTGIEIDMGSFEGGVSPIGISLDQYYQGFGKAFVAGDYNTRLIVVSGATNTLGFQVNTRTTQTSAKIFFNNSQVGSTLTLSNPNVLNPATFYIGSNHQYATGLASEYSSKQCAFASIGSGLTDGESSTFYSLVQAMQTSLTRNV